MLPKQKMDGGNSKQQFFFNPNDPTNSFDVYINKNPKDTIRISFKTPADARATVAKVKRIRKPFARKIQILTVLEQRAKVAGKNQQAQIAKKGKEAIRKKHGKTKKVTKKS